MKEYFDTSIVVKWFKKNEDHHDESIKLRDRIFDPETDIIMSSYGLLELVRAQVKGKFPQKVIHDVFSVMLGLYDTMVIQNVPIEAILHLTKDIEVKLNQYASDALHLASAIHSGCDIFWTADHHHLKINVMDFMKSFGIEVVTLDNSGKRE